MQVSHKEKTENVYNINFQAKVGYISIYFEVFLGIFCTLESLTATNHVVLSLVASEGQLNINCWPTGPAKYLKP